jgi:5-methylcytosine-specific restriction endonuclease McrA
MGIIQTEKNRQRRLIDPIFAANEKKKGKRYRETHPEQRKASTRKYDQTHPEQKRKNKAIRRAREAAAPFIEHVELDVLYLRDKRICQLCYKKCRRKDASGDHIIPVSLGGPTSYQNMVLAHRSCNVAKNNRTIIQQMRLF